MGLGLLTLPEGAALAFVGIVIVLAGMLAFRLPDVRDGFRAWMGTAFGALYVSLLAFLAGILAIAPPMGPGAPLHGVLDPGRIWVLVLVATVWTFDSLAYLSGRTFRRGRFFPHISPNKTMSGVIGGTIAAIVVAGVLVWAVERRAHRGHGPRAGHRDRRPIGRPRGVDAQAGRGRQGFGQPHPRARGHPRPGRLVPLRRARDVRLPRLGQVGHTI
ncbi:MAG: phosphatidate cytidylyltransferase [Chloroflexota bacterium]